MAQEKPEINYQIYGRKNLGTPILVIPGLMSDLHAFDGISSSLVERGYTVVAYDPPDHGKSSKLSGFRDGRFRFVSIEGQANALEHVIRGAAKEYVGAGSASHKGYGKDLLDNGPVIVGHSAGAATAMKYLETGKSQGLMLIAPVYGLSKARPLIGLLRKCAPFFTPERFRLLFSISPRLSNQEKRERRHGSKTDTDGVYGMFEAAHAYKPRVVECPYPVGLVCGEHEVGIAKEQQEAIGRFIKTPKFQEYLMEGVSHNFLKSRRREIVESIDNYCNLLDRGKAQ